MCSYAQKKGDFSLGFAAGASYVSTATDVQILNSAYSSNTKTSPFEFTLSTELNYFLIDRLRIGVSSGLALQKNSTYENGGTEKTSTLIFAVGPTLSYYFRLADNLYYTPEIGAFYTVGKAKVPSRYHDLSMNTTGVELSVTVFALEFRPSDRLALAFSCGQLSKAAMAGRGGYKETRAWLSAEGFSASLNTSAVLGLRLYL